MIKYLSFYALLALAGCASESDHRVSDEATATIAVASSQAEDKANVDKAFGRLAEITYDRGYTYFTVKSIELTNSGVRLKAKMGNDPDSLKSLTMRGDGIPIVYLPNAH